MEAMPGEIAKLTNTSSHTQQESCGGLFELKGSNQEGVEGKKHDELNMSKNNSINLRILFSILTKYFWCSKVPLLQKKYFKFKNLETTCPLSPV